MTTPAQKPLHDDALPSVLEQLPGFVLSTDTEMRVTSAYGRAFDDVRVPAGELVGFTLEELMKDDPARDVVLDTYRAVLAGTPGRFEYRARAVGRYYDTRVEPLRDDEGRVVGATGLAIDVTERKATEGLFRSLFESASVGITIGDIATRRPVRANAAFQRMAGRDEDELRGLSFEQLGHPDDVPLLEKRRRQLERGEV